MNPTPNEVPELPEDYQIIPTEYLRHNPLPEGAVYTRPKLPGWKLSTCTGLVPSAFLETNLYATRAPLPASVPSGGAAERDAFKQWNDAKFRTLLAADADTWYYSDAHKRMAWDAGVEYGRRNTPAHAPMGETPETDAFVVESSQKIPSACDVGDMADHAERVGYFARKLERERDKALADLSALREKADAMAEGLKHIADPENYRSERQFFFASHLRWYARQLFTAYTGKEAK